MKARCQSVVSLMRLVGRVVALLGIEEKVLFMLVISLDEALMLVAEELWSLFENSGIGSHYNLYEMISSRHGPYARP